MSQQAQNDYYAEDGELALAYADAVNDELRDLKAAGADVVQIDEPYLQARPEQAREYAIEAINRALDGIEGDTVLHTCFGYAHIVHDRPSGYPFLGELDDCAATHLSLEAAQPNLDPEVLRDVAEKTIVLGVLDLGSEEVETPEVVAGRIRKALAVLPRERLVVAPGLRDEVPPARACVPQAAGDGCRCAPGRRGSLSRSDRGGLGMTMKLNMLPPSVNNMSVRVFVRAAGFRSRRRTSGGRRSRTSTWPSSRRA